VAVQVIIRANASNEYRVIVEIAGRQFEVLIDTGFTDPSSQVGLGLDNNSYQDISADLQDSLGVGIYPVGATTPVQVQSGITAVSIFGLDDSQVLTRVVNAGENVLGVCFFHQLTDFEVLWDLAQRTLTIRRHR